MKNINEYIEWEKISKYNAGKADLVTTILNLHENNLPVEVRDWLLHERVIRRDESIKAIDNAIKAIKEGSE